MAADTPPVSAGPDPSDQLIREVPGRFRTGDAGVCAALAVATIATYANVRQFHFVGFDDPLYPLNYHLRQGFTRAAIKWAFTNSEEANWHPLTWLSHLLDYQLFGPQAGPDHIVSLIIHVLASLTLFLALRRATGALWRSALVSYLFALHPLHVESVAWVSERKDVLCAFFWFLTLLAWVRYARNPSVPRYLIVLVPLCLGLLSKPMIVTIPFVLLLIDIWPLGRRVSARLVLEKVPLLALSAASSVITFLVQRSGGAMMLNQVPFGLRVENALVAWMTYIGAALWPARLAFLYPYPGSIPLLQPVVSGAAIAAVSILVVRSFRRYPYLAIGWFWYLGTLIPVIGLIQVGFQARADRYMYVPMVGLSIMLAWGAGDLVSHWPRAKTWIVSALAVACIALIPATLMQLRYWENSESLFVHAIQVTGNNYIAYRNLGVVLLDVPGRAAEALAAFAAEVRIRPNSAQAHTDLGMALRKTGRRPDAIREYQTALRIDPDYAQAHNDLGAVWADMGLFPDALREYEASVRADPMYAEGHINLGGALATINRLPEAMAEDEAALRINPGLAAAHYNRASVLLRMGLVPDAVSELQTALQIQPDDAKAHNVLGVALLQTEGRSLDGIDQLEEAVKIDPNLADAHANLALALARIPGRMPNAIGHIRTALGIRRDPRWENLLQQMELRVQAKSK